VFDTLQHVPAVFLDMFVLLLDLFAGLLGEVLLQKGEICPETNDELHVKSNYIAQKGLFLESPLFFILVTFRTPAGVSSSVPTHLQLADQFLDLLHHSIKSYLPN